MLSTKKRIYIYSIIIVSPFFRRAPSSSSAGHMGGRQTDLPYLIRTLIIIIKLIIIDDLIFSITACSIGRFLLVSVEKMIVVLSNMNYNQGCSLDALADSHIVCSIGRFLLVSVEKMIVALSSMNSIRIWSVEEHVALVQKH